MPPSSFSSVYVLVVLLLRTSSSPALADRLVGESPLLLVFVLPLGSILCWVSIRQLTHINDVKTSELSLNNTNIKQVRDVHSNEQRASFTSIYKLRSSRWAC